MKMKKSAIVFSLLLSYPLQHWRKVYRKELMTIYAERYQSAKSIFEKLIAANPNNMEATYWVGQNILVMNKLLLPDHYMKKHLLLMVMLH